MRKKKSIDLEIFLNLYEKFTNIPTWTKEKHERFAEVEKYLTMHKVVTFTVKPNSKYNYCAGTHSFRIMKVPNDQLGNLSLHRNEWVLIICNSSTKGGWSQYVNKVYHLAIPFDENKNGSIEKIFGNYFIT
jgi:hypothetical protein